MTDSSGIINSFVGHSGQSFLCAGSLSLDSVHTVLIRECGGLQDILDGGQDYEHQAFSMLADDGQHAGTLWLSIRALGALQRMLK